MTDLVSELGGWAAIRNARDTASNRPTSGYSAPADDGSRWRSTDERTRGRHAFDEDALLTPIFHALAMGGWPSRTADPAPARLNPAGPARLSPAAQVEAEFRRDPLTAPLPVQALVPEPSRPMSGRHRPRHAPSAADLVRSGRHHAAPERAGRNRGW